MERDAFLARLRDRLLGDRPRSIVHAPRHPDVVAVPEFATDSEDPITTFVTAAEGNGAEVRTITGYAEARSVLEEVKATEGVTTAVVSADPEVSALNQAARESGITVLDGRGPATAAKADLGITGAAYAVAATGSIVVASDRARGRSVSLLPPVHLAFIHIRNLLPTPAALWRALPTRFPDGLPSQLVMINGPSKTGDIELVLTTGVHGPRSVWFCLVE